MGAHLFLYRYSYSVTAHGHSKLNYKFVIFWEIELTRLCGQVKVIVVMEKPVKECLVEWDGVGLRTSRAHFVLQYWTVLLD